MKKIIIIILIEIICVGVIFFFVFINQRREINELAVQEIMGTEDNNVGQLKNDEATIQSIDINYINKDSKGKNYSFIYNDKKFNIKYSKDNWKIFNSYLIRNEKDMAIICQALIDIYPIHGKDGISYRTVEDMVNEWKIHNLAYDILPYNSELKEHAKDVDLDSKDEGKNIQDFLKEKVN